MKFLHRFAIICNLCYFSTIVLNYVNGIDKYPIIANIIAILGVLSFFINIIVLLISLVVAVIGKKHLIPKSLFFINLVILLFQIFHHFASK